MKTKTLATLLLALACAGCITGAVRISDARVQELQNQRFGMFICWSFSTFSGKEWTPGVTNINFFRATECDTEQWARTAKEAGMGYILFLTKHHDGFCLWDTKTTDRKVTKAPLGCDVLAELKKSCDKHGIKLALYFSEGEWRQPGGLDDPATPEPKKRNQGGTNAELKKAQLKELLTQCGPVEYIWFDHAVGDGGLSHAETVAWCKQFQPGCFIGFNHGEQGEADIRLGEMGRPGPLGDHSAAGPHMKNPAGKNYRLAEFTYPILPKHKGGAMWFYSLPEHDGLCMSAEKIYADYLGAKKFGNVFALDVGPDYRGRIRDIDVVTLRKVGELIRTGAPLPEPIRAFCVDFNWGPGGPNGFAPPGLWADADPAQHVAWYAGLGANVLQTFAVSCNGYAWYKGGKIPAQPGLKSDFLPEVVKLGHAKGMQVMGYFCIAANTRWGAEHPDLSYGTPSAYHIPFTDAYLDYLAVAIEEALAKSGMDGFMVDWLWNPADKVRAGKWLNAEKKLFEQLTGQPFPGEDKLTAEAKLAYERKALDRCWERIRSTAKRVKPDGIIWLSCNKVSDPTIAGSPLLKELDWMMDESGTPDAMRAVAPMFGAKTRQLLCVVGWGDRHDARKIVSDAANGDFGIYGFSRPGTNSLPLPIATYATQPPDSFRGNDRNIAVLARLFNGQPLPPPASSAVLPAGMKVRASSEWNAEYSAAKACDGDESTRWGAAPESRAGWLEVDLGAEKEINRALVMELGHHRTEQFAIECKAGAAWKPLVTGTTIAGRRVYDFAPEKARVFRLNIIKASEVPTIEEFQLLAPGAKLPEALEKAKQDEAKRAARLQWFHEAKYGFFINWGLYSIPAGEWKGQKIGGIGEWIMHNARIPVKEYEQLAQQFNPAKFNADEWAQLAADAGMKYVVFDCKHHDGFALYRSAVSKYNCFDGTPWHRDPFKELQAACARRGLKFCFYYSQATDWHEPNGANNNWDFPPNPQKDFDQYFRDKSMPQVRELLTNYGPIGLIWFDVPTLMTPARCQQLVDLVRTLQPDTLINSRLGPGGLQDYQSRGDNEIPHTVTPGAWETAATINDTWGYKKDDQRWKTPEDICFKLVDIVSKGGNYLLNVGPDGEGAIPQPSQDILRTVGAWLKRNGDAIYGAGRTPFGDELGSYDPAKKDKKGRPAFNAKTDWRCTTKPGKLFIHFFKWPAGKFELAGVKEKIAQVSLLATHQPLPFTQDGEKVSVTLPEKALDALATVLCLETK
jgi:alpha-L-fucosidase